MSRVKIVRASAGSGKTYNLAYEYIRNVILDPERYRHILAVTFTNKATEEMKQRILKHINLLANGENEDFERRLLQEINDDKMDVAEIRRRAAVVRNNILHDYSNFCILTIDKFFQRIFRSFLRELSVDLNFNTELQTDTILDNAADKLIEDMSEDAGLRDWVLEYVGENISASRRWNIKDSLVALGKEIFKENSLQDMNSEDFKDRLKRVMDDLNRQVEQVGRSLMGSAREFLAVMDENGLSESDFYQGSRGVANFVRRVADGDIVNTSSYAMKALNEGVWCSAKAPKRGVISAIEPTLTTILETIIKQNARLQTSMNNLKLLLGQYRNFALIMDLQKNKEELCARERILPLSDITNIISDLVADNDAPFIFEKTGNRFTHYMIDEFQDTSALQWANFLPLLYNAESQSEDAVLLVGDVKQSIYRWRGGDWSLLAEKAEKAFNEPEVRFLQNNYRSAGDIVKFNNALMASFAGQLNSVMNDKFDVALRKGHIGKELYATYYDMIERAYADCRQEPQSDKRGYITVSVYDEYNEEQEDPVVERILELLAAGYRPCDIAVLVRTNENARQVAELLLDYKNRHEGEVNFNIVTHEALTIGNSKLCAFIVSCMGLAVMPDDVIHRAVYNHWRGEKFETPISEDDAQFFTYISMKSPQEAFEEIVVRYNLAAIKTEMAYMQALHDKVIDFCRSKIADIGLFVEWWNEEGKKKSIDMPRSDDAVIIATIHKAKGLEYKVVVLPYCSWSLTTSNRSILWAQPKQKFGDIASFPMNFSQQMAESDFSESYYEESVLAYIDNLNILYVAVTRAVKELHVIVPPHTSRSNQTIGVVLRSLFNASDEEIVLADVKGTVQQLDRGICYSFGERVLEQESSTEDNIRKIGFDTHLPEERLAIKYSAERYGEAADGDKLHMRDYGVLMHKVFETAADRSQIETAVAELRHSGLIGEEECRELNHNIDDAFKNPLVADWFSEKWDEVRTEAEILLPGGKIYRPDRVMISSDCVHVVDYKFGLEGNASYERQMRRYMNILTEMGYSNVRGYLWYISKNEIVAV